MTFRTYHDVVGDDRSRLGEQIGEQRRRVSDRLSSIGSVVAVMSGKGGVGKSHVTASIAVAVAARAAAGVGVLDADLTSPTVARLLDARGPVVAGPDGIQPAVGRAGVRIFSSDLLLAEGDPLRWRSEGDEAFAWRGALETGATREFLADVVWGGLDLLLIDLPPGTDRLTDIATLVPDLAGAIAVTIPSEESARSVARAIRSARGAGVRVLGIVENMTGYACPCCGVTGPLFSGDAGAALSSELDLPLLARIPFSPAGARCQHPGSIRPDAARRPAPAAGPDPVFDALASRLEDLLA